MESRSKRFVRAGDLPVSLIMADCNYLKRTNDTLGHEYGDLLLQPGGQCHPGVGLPQRRRHAGGRGRVFDPGVPTRPTPWWTASAKSSPSAATST